MQDHYTSDGLAAAQSQDSDRPENGGNNAFGKSARHFPIIPLAERLATVTRWLEEHKAERIVSIELKEQGAFADVLLVLTAGSMRHGQSLADGLAELCRDRQYEFLRMEGYATGQWILVDLNDMIVNIFLEPVRDLYRLESLWGHAPGAEKGAEA